MLHNKCEQLREEYQALVNQKDEFVLAYRDVLDAPASAEAADPKDQAKKLALAKQLKAELEKNRDKLQEKLWPFEGLTQKEAKEQYEKAINGYRELGLLKTLSSGKEGITRTEIEQGKEKEYEYPIPSMMEVFASLRQNRELATEKLATMENPRIHLTPFALSPEAMAETHSKQIEDHFIEERIEGDKRVPAKTSKLLGVDGQPLELRANKQNIYFLDELKEQNLKYFPEWEKQGSAVKAEGGISKAEAIKKIGGWSIIILEDIPLAPEKGQGKTIEKEIKVRGKTKKEKIARTQVEGGMDLAAQYEKLKQQNEQGLTEEDYLSYALLHLRETNQVLDDDRKTSYYCRLLGAVPAVGFVPYGYWPRHYRQFYLGRSFPEGSNPDYVVRAGVRVLTKS